MGGGWEIETAFWGRHLLGAKDDAGAGKWGKVGWVEDWELVTWRNCSRAGVGLHAA
jgi:hypothetical protein